jgi:hypothetical protein
MPQRRFEVRVRELEAVGREDAWFDAGAGKERFVGHLAERQAGGECRHRENRGAMKYAAERLCEFAIRDRLGRGRVHGTGEGGGRECELNYTDQVA